MKTRPARSLCLYLLLAVIAVCGNRASAGTGATVHLVEPDGFTLSPATQAAEDLTLVVRAKPGTAEGDSSAVLALIGSRMEGTRRLDFGWIPVEPGRRYRAAYRVRAAAPDTRASFYLMIRPHAARETRPIQPYPRTSIRHRALAGGADALWEERALEFETGDGITFLSGSIVVTELDGEIHFSEWRLVDLEREETDAAEGARAEQTLVLAELHAAAARRTRRTPRPLVFTRGQIKYGLDRSYYHHEYSWLDRPLMVNRAYRPPITDGIGPGWLHPAQPGPDVPRNQVVPPDSLLHTLRELRLYGLDGMAFFPQSSDRMPLFDLAERLVAENPDLSGMQLLAEFIGGRPIESYVEMLERALASPLAPRIDGRLLITSYGASSDGPAAWGERLTALRERFGDVFVFLPTLATGGGLRGAYRDGTLTRAAIEEARAELRTWLDVCDGIYFNYPPAFRAVGVMPRPFDRDFYENVFIPLFRSVLAEPPYHEKLLGLSAYRSHMMPERGNTLHEDGTRTLRNSLEPALAAEPDVILLPEWDEQNENTSWRPTIYSGTATRRIVRHYMDRIRGVPPAPMPGDDTQIPNLVLAARALVTLGEEAVFEILNIPDTDTPRTFQVELILHDTSGQTLHTHGPVLFDASRLQEERLSLPTEAFPDATALVPRLRILDDAGGERFIEDGLPHTLVRATWNWNHLFIRQAVRDLVRAETVRLAWVGEPGPDGTRWIEGAFSADEPLALVEVMADDREVYAADPSDEFFRADPGRSLFLIDYRAFERVPFEGTVTLENAQADWFFQGPMLHQPETGVEVDGSTVRLSGVASVHTRWVYLAVPSDAVSAARLRIETGDTQLVLPLAEVQERGIHVHAAGNGLSIAVSPYGRQIDMPFHLDRNEVSFRVRVWPETACEQYHLRVTTKSGRTFRSRPLPLPPDGPAERERLRIFSSREQRGLDVTVDRRRIPDIVYAFDPVRGAVLWTPAGRPFWASLGGYVSPVIGRGAATGIHRRDYPPQTAPAWIPQDGGTAHALRFDGVGTFLKLPLETLPRRGAFTLMFDVRPATGRDQVLLMNRIGSRQKGLTLEVQNGRLTGSFRAEDWSTERFPTGLTLPAGTWSRVRVSYDFEHLTFEVNGETESFPFSKPACNNGYTLIGDGWRNANRWYEGELRNLRIRHNAGD